MVFCVCKGREVANVSGSNEVVYDLAVVGKH